MEYKENISAGGEECSSRKREILFFILIFLGASFPFLFAADHPFLQDWDDYTFIVRNGKLDLTWENVIFYFTNTFQDLHTPLPLLSFMADKALWGLAPLPYRLENIFIHAVNAWLLYRIFSLLGIRNLLAFAGALLWAVNPQKVESCIWITERKDVLCGLFSFGAILAFLYEKNKERLPYLSSFLILPALFSKPAALPLCGVMTLILIGFQGRKYNFREYAKKLFLPYLITLIGFLYSYMITRNGFPGGAESRLLVPLHNLFWYPLTAMIPFEWSPMYPNIAEFTPHIPLFLGGGGVFFLLLYLARKLDISLPVIGLFLLAVLGMIIPVLGLVHYTAMDYCDRYNYLVSAPVLAFLFFLAEKALVRFPDRKKYFYIPLAFCCCIYGFMCIRYGKVWRESGGLFLYAVEKPAGSPANETAIENGASSAIRSNDSGMLERFAMRMEQDNRLYRPGNRHLLHTALFFRAHAAMVRGEREKALEKYILLARLAESGELDLMRPEEFLKVLFRGGAVTALSMGAARESHLFFREYFRVQKTPNAEYFFMLSRRGILERNPAMRHYALTQLVKLLPGNTGFRKELLALEKGMGKR